MKTITKPAFRIVLLCVLIGVCLIAQFFSPVAQAASNNSLDTELFVGDKIGFVYYTQIPYEMAAHATFSINGRESSAATIPYGDYTAFQFDDIYPHELNQEISVHITGGSGSLNLSDYNFTYADINEDGLVTSDDVTILQHYINGSPQIYITNANKLNYDFNKDGNINLQDKTSLTYYYSDADTFFMIDVSYGGITVKSMLLEMLSSTNSNKAQFAADLLYYGEQTRIYRNLNIASDDKNLESITDDINPTVYPNYKPRVLEDTFSVAGTAAGLGQSASAVRMKSIGFSYYNTNKYSVFIEMPSSYNVASTSLKIGDVTYNSDRFELMDTSQNTKIYRVQSNPVDANSLFNSSQPVSTQLQLYYGSRLVHEATYSVKDYVLQLQSTAGDSAALNYAKSLYAYAYSANKLYGGRYPVAISVAQLPGDTGTPGTMKATTTSNLTPQNGKIRLYYSDGTVSTVNAMSWTPVASITSSAETVKRTTKTSYTALSTGRKFTVATQITLSNPLDRIERWTDPDVINLALSPSTTYEPSGGLVKAIWTNGYFTMVEPDYSPVTVNRSSMYARLSTTASYGTKTCTAYVIVNNAPELTAADIDVDEAGSVEFTDGEYANITGAELSYKLRTGVWNMLEQDDGSFTWQNAHYAGTQLTGFVDAVATVTVPASPVYQIYVEGNPVNWQKAQQTVSKNVSVPFLNIPKAMSGSGPANYQVSRRTREYGYDAVPNGWTITVTLGNNKTLTFTEGQDPSAPLLAADPDAQHQFYWALSNWITDATPSMASTMNFYLGDERGDISVDLEAHYSITLLNPVVSSASNISITKTATSPYTVKYIEIKKTDISVSQTYANGYQSPAENPTGWKLGTKNVSNIYIRNICDGTFEAPNITTGWSNTTLTTNEGTMKYVLANGQVGGITVTVINPPKEILQLPDKYPTKSAAKYTNKNLQISKSNLNTQIFTLIFANGWQIDPLSGTEHKQYLKFRLGTSTTLYDSVYVANIIDDDTKEDRSSATNTASGTPSSILYLQYKNTNYSFDAVKCSVVFRVTNAIKTVSRYTDAVRKATSTSPISGDTWIGTDGNNYIDPKVKVTYTNEYERKDVAPTKIEGSVTLSGTDASKSNTQMKAYFGSSKWCYFTAWLYNDIKSSGFNTWTAINAASAALATSSGFNITATTLYTLSNTQTIAGNSASRTQHTVGGVDTRTTTDFSGNGAVSLTMTATAKAFGDAIIGYSGGLDDQELMGAWTLPEVSAKPKVYWKNPALSYTTYTTPEFHMTSTESATSTKDGVFTLKLNNNKTINVTKTCTATGGWIVNNLASTNQTTYTNTGICKFDSGYDKTFTDVSCNFYNYLKGWIFTSKYNPTTINDKETTQNFTSGGTSKARDLYLFGYMENGQVVPAKQGTSLKNTSGYSYVTFTAPAVKNTVQGGGTPSSIRVTYHFSVSNTTGTISWSIENSYVYLPRATGYNKTASVSVKYTVSGGPGGCFTGDTQVTMSDGSTKNIADVKVGDNVISYDEYLDEFVIENVEEVLCYGQHDIYRVEFEDGTFVDCTASHPFFTTNGWAAIDTENGRREHGVKCSTLDENSNAITQNGSVRVVRITDLHKQETVYNLTVSNTHTYIAGGVVVHNAKTEH